MLASEVTHASTQNLTDKYVDSISHTRIKLHNDKDIWMISLISLVRPRVVIYNNNNCETDVTNIHTDDRIEYVIEPMRKWGFIPNYTI